MFISVLELIPFETISVHFKTVLFNEVNWTWY